MTTPPHILDRRWVSLGYGALVLALIVQELGRGQLPADPTLPLVLLGALLITAPLAGALIGPGDKWQRSVAAALLVINGALTLALVATTGGVYSAMWPALLVPITSALLVLPGTGGVAALAIWLAYGLVAAKDADPLLPTVGLWLVQSCALLLVGLILQRFRREHAEATHRTSRRETALAHFLAISNQLRVSTHADMVLTEVAGAVQAAGQFDCVTISTVDWTAGTAQVVVAIGASGRHLTALEGLTVPWSTFATMLEGGEPAGSDGRYSAVLPFRTIRRERHLLLPLVSALEEPKGVLTVSTHQDRAEVLEEARPLLELLANQAGAALDNTALFSTLEARVQQATAALERGADELRAERDHAETLYHYVLEKSEQLGATARQREEEASTSLAILRSIGDGVVVGDERGHVLLVNPAAEQILGIRSDLFVGRSLLELPGTPPAGPLATDQLQQISVGERSVRAHAAPVRSASGKLIGSVVVYHDITREVLADKLKSEFVSTASHELRTPLTSIRGYVDMLLLGTIGPLSGPQREFVQIIKNNVERLVELIDELLDMSKAEAGEVRLRRDQVDLAEVLSEVTVALGGQFRQRAVALNVAVQPNLPRVSADRQRVRQIMVNLVGNACKYTPSGGNVLVGLRNGGGELQMDVRDTGVGIAIEAQAHIFTPFYRAENPLRDEAGGTGLGLAITRKLVELHGGRIWFESAEGHGSTFSFTLPLRRGPGASSEF